MREAVHTGNVVGDLQGGLASGAQGVSGGVHVASKGTSAIGVDLVDRDSEFAAGLDLCDLAGGQGVLGVLADVDVARQLRSSALVDHVGGNLGVSDQRGILLARADARAVSCDGRVDFCDMIVSVCLFADHLHLLKTYPGNQHWPAILPLPAH